MDAFPYLGFLEPLRSWVLPPRGSGPRWVNGAVRASRRRKGRDESDKHVLGEDTFLTRWLEPGTEGQIEDLQEDEDARTGGVPGVRGGEQSTR